MGCRGSKDPRWAFVTYRYPNVACQFRWRWRTKLHSLFHLEPGEVMPSKRYQELKYLRLEQERTAEKLKRDSEEMRLSALRIGMSGIGHHVEPCRVPDTECLCGTAQARADARALLEQAIAEGWVR